MGDKVGIGAIVLVVVALVAALGYIVIRNGTTIAPLFERGERETVQTSRYEKNSGISGISVLFPDGKTPLEQGKAYTLTWTGGNSLVTLSVEKRGSFFSGNATSVWKIENIRNNGSYIWYVPYSAVGTYVLHVSDGKSDGYSDSFTVQQPTGSSGWTVYVDPQNFFEIQYPGKMRQQQVQQNETYPYKQLGTSAAGYIRGVVLSADSWSSKNPDVTVQTYASDGKTLDAWLSLHQAIRDVYSIQTKRTVGSNTFYKFSGVKDKETRRNGIIRYQERKDIPQEMYITLSGARAFVILIDFGSTGKYTMYPEDIVKTFKIR